MPNENEFYFTSCGTYITKASTLKEKVRRLDLVIDALLDAAIASAAAGEGGKQGYELQDGQMTIKLQYRSSAAVSEAIMGFERVKEFYVNKLNGHRVRLVDGRSIYPR